MQWYYSENGGQAGPVSELELRGKITAGSIKAQDLVWREGMAEWQSVASLPELANSLPSMPAEPPAAPPAAPGSPYQSPTTPQPANVSAGGGYDIPTYLWQAIVVTILCCWPLGIPAIVYAAKVDGLKRTGDLQAARAASDSAKTWCWIAFGLGLVSNLAVFAMFFASEA